jgi:hypothetical protein
MLIIFGIKREPLWGLKTNLSQNGTQEASEKGLFALVAQIPDHVNMCEVKSAQKV